MGSDVDSQITFNHCTALTLACLEERDIVVSLLINNNANIEHSTKVIFIIYKLLIFVYLIEITKKIYYLEWINTFDVSCS